MNQEDIDHYVDNLEQDTKDSMLKGVLFTLLEQKTLNDLKDKEDVEFLELAVIEFNKNYPKGGELRNFECASCKNVKRIASRERYIDCDTPECKKDSNQMVWVE